MKTKQKTEFNGLPGINNVFAFFTSCHKFQKVIEKNNGYGDIPSPWFINNPRSPSFYKAINANNPRGEKS